MDGVGIFSIMWIVICVCFCFFHPIPSYFFIFFSYPYYDEEKMLFIPLLWKKMSECEWLNVHIKSVTFLRVRLAHHQLFITELIIKACLDPFVPRPGMTELEIFPRHSYKFSMTFLKSSTQFLSESCRHITALYIPQSTSKSFLSNKWNSIRPHFLNCF